MGSACSTKVSFQTKNCVLNIDQNQKQGYMSSLLLLFGVTSSTTQSSLLGTVYSRLEPMTGILLSRAIGRPYHDPLGITYLSFIIHINTKYYLFFLLISCNGRSYSHLGRSRGTVVNSNDPITSPSWVQS